MKGACYVTLSLSHFSLYTVRLCIKHVIIIPIPMLPYLYIFSSNHWENVLYELRSDRVKAHSL